MSWAAGQKLHYSLNRAQESSRVAGAAFPQLLAFGPLSARPNTSRAPGRKALSSPLRRAALERGRVKNLRFGFAPEGPLASLGPKESVGSVEAFRGDAPALGARFAGGRRLEGPASCCSFWTAGVIGL